MNLIKYHQFKVQFLSIPKLITESFGKKIKFVEIIKPHLWNTIM